jgi:anthranilate phosphoribosyltransferase
MRNVAGPRREIGVRTIFNLLGPLTNPAGARRQVVGVFDRRWLVPVAEALGRLGGVHAMVVHGGDGLDEITLTTETHVAELREGEVRVRVLKPADLGLRPVAMEELRVGSVKESAEVVARVLRGERGPCRDLVLANAAAALYVGGHAASLAEGVGAAAAAIDSGAAREKLARFVELTNKLEPSGDD